MELPHFDYKGRMCSMASFKQHCAFSVWKAALMKDPENILRTDEKEKPRKPLTSSPPTQTCGELLGPAIVLRVNQTRKGLINKRRIS